MAKTNNPGTTKVSKKTVQVEIAKKLEESFADLAEVLGPNRFKRRIKKASKILGKNIKRWEEKAGKAKATTNS